MSRSLEFFCGVGSKKSEHKAISATISHDERGPAVGVYFGTDGFQM
jgi:hypothetical protein